MEILKQKCITIESGIAFNMKSYTNPPSEYVDYARIEREERGLITPNDAR